MTIWQCDAAGNYSEYSQPGYDGSGETFLRGYQTTDASGLSASRELPSEDVGLGRRQLAERLAWGLQQFDTHLQRP